MLTSLPPDIHPEGKYNAKETAKLLGINRRTLYRWVKSGRMKPPRISRATRKPRFSGKDLLTLWRSEF